MNDPTRNVELLSEPTNFAVVHLPGRKFPGVVFQGDTLDSVLCDLASIRDTGAISQEDAALTLSDLIETLEKVQAHYERVCREKGLSLPYSK